MGGTGPILGSQRGESNRGDYEQSRRVYYFIKVVERSHNTSPCFDDLPPDWPACSVAWHSVAGGCWGTREVLACDSASVPPGQSAE